MPVSGRLNSRGVACIPLRMASGIQIVNVCQLKKFFFLLIAYSMDIAENLRDTEVYWMENVKNNSLMRASLVAQW